MAEAVDEDSSKTSDATSRKISIIIKTAKEKETIEIAENEKVLKVIISDTTDTTALIGTTQVLIAIHSLSNAFLADRSQ